MIFFFTSFFFKVLRYSWYRGFREYAMCSSLPKDNGHNHNAFNVKLRQYTLRWMCQWKSNHPKPRFLKHICVYHFWRKIVFPVGINDMTGMLGLGNLNGTKNLKIESVFFITNQFHNDGDTMNNCYKLWVLRRKKYNKNIQITPRYGSFR